MQRKLNNSQVSLFHSRVLWIREAYFCPRSLAQGVMKAINVNKLTSAGCRVKIWIADWFAQLNNKMGGDLKKIETVGQYLIEIWKAVGMDLEGGKVEFLWSSKEINSRASEYWPLVMDIARRNKLPRIIRYKYNIRVWCILCSICNSLTHRLLLGFPPSPAGVAKLWEEMSRMSWAPPKFSIHACNVPTFFSWRFFSFWFIFPVFCWCAFFFSYYKEAKI